MNVYPHATMQVRGKTVYLQYSTRQEIVNSKTQGDTPSNVLLVTLEALMVRLAFRLHEGQAVLGPLWPPVNSLHLFAIRQMHTYFENQRTAFLTKCACFQTA